MRHIKLNPLRLALAILALAVPAIEGRAQNILTLVDYTNVWRFNDSGANLGTNWSSTGFNDAAWRSGSGVLGYPADEDLLGVAELQTTMNRYQADGETPVITYYLRSRFFFPSNTSRVLLVASNLVDDGAVFYLNGVDVGRLSLPTSGVLYNTLATRNNDIVDTIHRVETRFFPSNSLVQGTNVLAVELHQGATDSDDAILGLRLLAYLPLPPAITEPPTSQTNHPGRKATFSVTAVGRTPIVYQWTRNGTNLANTGRISGVTTPQLTMTNLAFSDAGNYRVRVTNAFGAVTSAVATLTVVSDLQSPNLLSAEGHAPGSTVVVTFDEPVSPATATNPANYRVASLQCTPAHTVAVSNVVHANDQVTLSLGPYSNACLYVLTVNHVLDTAEPPNLIRPNSQIGITFTFTTNVFGMNQPWTFNQGVGFECPTSLGTAWRETNYVEDFSWGGPVPGILYFDQQPIAPCTGSLSYQLGVGCNAYYFRTRFLVTNTIPPGAQLVFRHYIDDGAVFYLNGREIYRYNMPSSDVTYNTRATQPRDGTCVTSPALTNAPLVRGTNWLAVEVHQNETPGSQGEDVGFGTTLDLVYRSAPVLIPELNIDRQGPDVFLSWNGTGLILEAKTNLNETAWTVVPATTNRLVIPASGPRKFFRLRN